MKLLKPKKDIYKIQRKDIDFFIELATTLALPYEEQHKQLYMLGDYITHDIASDWLWNAIGHGVMKMFQQNLISDYVVNLYKEIDKNFEDISLGGPLDEDDFWTLKGLKTHPLWEEQRKKAREVISILEKIECE